MTLNEICLIIIAAWLGTLCAAFAIGRLDRQEPDPRAAHPYPKMKRRAFNKTYNRMITSLLEEDPGFAARLGPVPVVERVTGPGPGHEENPAVYLPPDDFDTMVSTIAAAGRERLASTGELRAAAYAGDMDAVRSSVDAFVASLDDEGEAA